MILAQRGMGAKVRPRLPVLTLEYEDGSTKQIIKHGEYSTSWSIEGEDDQRGRWLGYRGNR